MPTIHIPENIFGEFVDREGGYDAAKAAVIDTLEAEVADD